MPTPGERRALIFIASVGALGVAARGWKEFHPQDPRALAGSRTELARQIQAVDSAIAVGSSRRKARAPRAPKPDSSQPNTAPPRRSRPKPSQPADSHPPRDPREDYWARAERVDSANRAAGRATRDASNRVPRSEPSSQPPGTFRRPPSRIAQPPVDLDVAGIDEIATIPLIGAALARRIVADRSEFGPFGSIVELERVPGLTTAFARRLAPFVTFSRAPRLGGAGERRPRSKSERRPGGESRP